MDTKQKQKLKRIITHLDSIRGRHTELVSVYIPAGYDIHKITNHLFQEQGTASNIKDKRTRENVIASLEKIIRHLRLFKQTPENGLAVFAGNTSEKDNVINIEVFSVEPPIPLNTRIYRCDQTFMTDILKDMIEHTETYGLVVIDRREATLGLLRGTAITVLTEFSSNVPGKTTKGGQSQQRYARLREEAAKEFFKKVGEAMNKEFFQKKDLKGILVGGPGPTKEDFLKGDYIYTDVKNNVIAVKDLSYTGQFGLDELVDKSHDVLAKEAVIDEKKLMEEFFRILKSEREKGVIGLEKVKQALEMNAVKTLLVSEELDDSILQELEKMAEKTGAELKMISVETREGEQLKEMGGVGAILRFKIYT